MADRTYVVEASGALLGIEVESVGIDESPAVIAYIVLGLLLFDQLLLAVIDAA